MDNETALRLLTTLEDMLDNQRALTGDRGEVRLVFSTDFALQIASAAAHVTRGLKRLGRVTDTDAFSEFVPVEGRPGYVMHRPRREGRR